MNYNNFAQETSRMVELMKYGINESTSKSSAPRVEYSVKAADGLTYGIVNEGTKFYIKVAPKKDTKILNEDFDYIGGEMNKKENEYKSYGAAYKNLELKLMQINESHKNGEKVIVEASKKAPACDWQINETVEMRNAIDRMNQISRNVAHILTEGSIPSEHTLPEAPAKNPSQEKVNTPFTDTAVANGDKDFKDTETNYEKPSGTPYSEKSNAKLTSDRKPTMSGDNGNAYSDNALYAPKGSVANEHPTGGKVARADESKRTIKLTEEQVLAWNRSNDDYMDKSHGTDIGSSVPFDEKLNCKTSNQCPKNAESIEEAEGPVHNSDTTLYPNGGTGEPAYDSEPFNDVIAESDFDDYDEDGVYMDGDDDYDEPAGFDGYDNSGLPFPEVEDDNEDDKYELELDGDDENTIDAAYQDMENADFIDHYGEENGNGEYDEDEELYEVTLHDFGKHPAYRKTPMTLPPNKEVAPNNVRDWNDESAEDEEPFGEKIGSSAPFEKAVQKITDSIMESLGF
jgi:hypothetical protein